MKAWPSGRKQRVQINGRKSNCGTINTGVTQGSVLGPLLFKSYINYLNSGISRNISKFSDDTKIERQISMDQEVMVLQGELNIMHELAVK